jgi:hypothetical protein
MKNKYTSAYLRTLFNRNEHICAADSIYGVKTAPLGELAQPTQFISVNPLIPGSTRLDENTAVFRNFLIEIDGLTLEEQTHYIEKEIVLPFSAKTFSGGKSFHYVISLADPLPDLTHYRKMAQWLLDVVTKADAKCKNPSRFTRMAGGMRGEVRQELIELKARVDANTLISFFERHARLIAEAEYKRQEDLKEAQATLVENPEGIPEGFRGDLTLRTKTFMREGAEPGARNSGLYFAAADFKNNCYTIEEAIEALRPIWRSMGKSENELKTTVKSAFQKAPIRPRLL